MYQPSMAMYTHIWCLCSSLPPPSPPVFPLLPPSLPFCRTDLIEAGLSPRVVVPAVNASLSTGRVLTMAYEPGIHSSDRNGIIQATLCHQVFRTGFVHCDPHPANVLVRPFLKGFPRGSGADGEEEKTRGAGETGGETVEPQLVLLDHGLYREISDAHRIQWCALWKGTVKQPY